MANPSLSPGDQFRNLIACPSSGSFFYSPAAIMVSQDLVGLNIYRDRQSKVFTLCSREYKLVMAYYVVGLVGKAFRIWPVTGPIYQTALDKIPQAIAEEWIKPISYDELCMQCVVGTIPAVLVPPDLQKNNWYWDAETWYIVDKMLLK
jgi:hypothetical protein